jgi:hypothetical protein
MLRRSKRSKIEALASKEEEKQDKIKTHNFSVWMTKNIAFLDCDVMVL